jgi:hypothetical protein
MGVVLVLLLTAEYRLTSNLDRLPARVGGH